MVKNFNKVVTVKIIKFEGYFVYKKIFTKKKFQFSLGYLRSGIEAHPGPNVATLGKVISQVRKK